MKTCSICGNIARRGNKCYKCISRERRKNNPERSCYYNLKSSAKRRNKIFDITFEQFKQFCTKTDYISKKGRTADSYHIDRIDENGGYTVGNIQLLTNTDNILKYKKCIMSKDEDGKIFNTKPVFEERHKDLPF